MSEASYLLNEQRGVTGPRSNTCLMAAYDRISPVTGISTQTYQRYEDLATCFKDAVGHDANFVSQDIVRQFAELKDEFRAQLGVPTDKNVVEARVNTQDELCKTLANLAVGGFRTAVYLDVGGLHAVGVIQLEQGYYDVRSTWSPFPDDVPVSATDLFDYLDLAPRQRTRESSSRKTEPACNIVALPPERAGSTPPYSCL